MNPRYLIPIAMLVVVIVLVAVTLYESRPIPVSFLVEGEWQVEEAGNLVFYSNSDRGNVIPWTKQVPRNGTLILTHQGNQLTRLQVTMIEGWEYVLLDFDGQVRLARERVSP